MKIMKFTTEFFIHFSQNNVLNTHNSAKSIRCNPHKSVTWRLLYFYLISSKKTSSRARTGAGPESFWIIRKFQLQPWKTLDGEYFFKHLCFHPMLSSRFEKLYYPVLISLSNLLCGLYVQLLWLTFTIFCIFPAR